MGNGNRKASITDVARLASVSPSTVSRYMNHPKMVGKDTRDAIAQAIEMLGFVRNRRASGLISNKSGVIGALVPTIGNAIFAEAIETFERTLMDRGFGLLLASTRYDLDNEYRQVRLLVEQGVDALMLVGNEHKPETFQLLDRVNLPFVTIWSLSGSAYHPEIGFDNHRAAHDVTRHLLDLGHRRFGLVVGLTGGNDRALSRLSGAMAAITGAGLAVPDDAVVECRYDVGHAYAVVRDHLDHGGVRPTALICGNDVIAHGALAACRDLGLAVPGDISIVGFGDFSFSAYLTPPLTTVRIPAKRIARSAAEALTDLVADGTEIRTQRIDYELKIRQTTAPPAGD